MNACVESVCPTPMMPESLETRANAQAWRMPTLEATREWLGKLWLGAVGAREAKVPPVVHVRVESFYAAVEQAEIPRLRGKAVLVVSAGAVASASLEAQSRGAVAGMKLRDARKACPNAIVIPGDYARYAEYAEGVRQILETCGSPVEMTACGSFYLDFSRSMLSLVRFEAALRRMQSEILGQTGLSVSVGAGTSRMVAALAACEHRPCGLRIVARGEEREFLRPLPIEKLRGIGQKQVSALMQGGLTTLGELQQIPKPVLVAAFGAAIGERIWNLARGYETRDSVERTAKEMVRSENPA